MVTEDSTYNANLKITSNDPVDPEVTIPVLMTVNPVPYYVIVSPAEQSMIDLPGDTVFYELNIHNLGENDDTYNLTVSETLQR